MLTYLKVHLPAGAFLKEFLPEEVDVAEERNVLIRLIGIFGKDPLDHFGILALSGEQALDLIILDDGTHLVLLEIDEVDTAVLPRQGRDDRIVEVVPLFLGLGDDGC